MKNNQPRLIRPSDALLPTAFLLATLLGRNALTTDLFYALMLARLCALATADGLRAAYAMQPSMRFVQGSTLAALITQLVGAAIALPLLRVIQPQLSALPLVACGLLLNIEHVFYEYMHAVGDGNSAMLCHSLAAGLTLTGLLLASPPWRVGAAPAGFNLLPLLTTCGLSALVGLVVSLALGGRLRAKLNGEVFRRAPLALLQTALFPAVWLVPTLFILPTGPLTSMPLFAGLALYALCRTPFRRTPAESRRMNRLLLSIGLACAAGCFLVSAIFHFDSAQPLLWDIPFALISISVACICAFAMYGNPKQIE